MTDESNPVEQLSKFNLPWTFPPTEEQVSKLRRKMEDAIEEFLDGQISYWEANGIRYKVHDSGYSFQSGCYMLNLPFFLADHYLVTRGIVDLFIDENEHESYKVNPDSHCLMSAIAHLNV